MQIFNSILPKIEHFRMLGYWICPAGLHAGIHAVRLLPDRSPDPSFPSDHSTGGFSLASMLFLSNRKSGALSLGFAALLAFSRVYTGAHYPFDVLGGAATGLISTVIVYLLRNKLEPLTHLILCTWDKISNLFRVSSCK